MNTDELVAALQKAEELASFVATPYREIAFRVAAENILAGGQTRPESGPSSSRSPGGAGIEGQILPSTVNELLALLQNNSHTDRLEAVIYFRLKVDGVDGVTLDEIMTAYTQARVSRPGNPHDVVLRCARRGHIMEGDRRDGKRTWRLTVTGDRYVEERIQEASGTQ